MELINTYISEVGLHLPGKMRKDVQAEIRSTIEDMLEDRGIDPALEENQDAVAEILKEIGPPNKVASGYKTGSNYLIGPKLYPMYIFIMRIIFIVVIASMALSWVVGAVTPSGVETNSVLFNWMAGVEFLTGLISLFGWVTLTFAVLDRVLDDKKKDSMQIDIEEKWNPLDLLKEDWAQPIRPVGCMISIVLSVAVLILVNLYPEFIAIYIFHDGIVEQYPLFNENFANLVVWIDLLMVIGISYNIILLRTGRWTIVNRWLNIAMDALTASFMFAVVFGGFLSGTESGFLSLQPLELLSEANAADISQGIMAGVNTGIGIGFFVAAVVISIMLVIRAVKLIRTM